MRLKCPHCRRDMQTAAASGETIGCPSCGQHVLVPAAAIPADRHPFHVRGWLLWMFLALLVGSFVVYAVTKSPREPGGRKQGDTPKPPTPTESPQQKRNRLEAERREVMEDLALLAGEGGTVDPFLLIDRCKQYRNRINKLISLARELGDPTDGLERLLPGLDRLERLAKLKAGVPD